MNAPMGTSGTRVVLGAEKSVSEQILGMVLKARESWGKLGKARGYDIVKKIGQSRDDRRAPRPPAAVSFGTGLGGQMNEVL